MVDRNRANDVTNKGNADGNNGKDADKVGKLSDGLLRLVEEDDGKGNVCYCVETVGDDKLVYSSVSKAQAFSFCEGYRAADGKDDSKSRKPKADDNNDNGDNGDKSATPKVVDPAKVQRRRMVF
jgi:hypothetical protein